MIRVLTATPRLFTADFSGAFIDRAIETRGLDYIDSEKAKRMAEDQTNQAIDKSDQFGN